MRELPEYDQREVVPRHLLAAAHRVFPHRGRLLLGVLLVLASLGSGAGKVAAYAQTITPWYTHSWYVDTTDTNQFQRLGAYDGAWDSNHCYGPGDNHSLYKLVILDFGRPINLTGTNSPYYGYGTVFPGGQNPDGTSIKGRYDTAVYLAEQYALYYYYNSQGNCQQLTLAMGQNNSYLCQNSPNNNPCDPLAAGQTWGDAVYQVNLWLTNNGLRSRITAAAANDMETYGAEWACAGPTQQWINGYTANNRGAEVYDDGDAITSAGCWNIQGVYSVANQVPGTMPLPETYTAGGVCYWTAGVGQECKETDPGVTGYPTDYTRGYGVEGSNAPMTFSGQVTECPNGDPVPYGPCTVNGHGEYGPGEGWQKLWDFQQTVYPQYQPSMEFSTNIQYQPRFG